MDVRVWDSYGSSVRACSTLFVYERCRWRCAIVAIVATAAVFGFSGIGHAAPIEPSDIHVIDGDTIRVFGKKPDVRLVGFNAPETSRAICQAERELGGQATRRVRDLVRAGPLDFSFVPCACSPGTEGTVACNYKRRCGILTSNGRDVGEILIVEKLAVPFQCGETRCPRTPKPWCN